MGKFRGSRLKYVLPATICLIAGIFIALIIGNGQAVAEAASEIADSLGLNATVVYDEVYGVCGGQYAVEEKKVQFDGNEDTSFDILKADGTTTIHTNDAMSPISGDPIEYSNYKIDRSELYKGLVGSATAPIVVMNKSNNKYGAFNKDGSKVIDFVYDKISPAVTDNKDDVCSAIACFKIVNSEYICDVLSAQDFTNMGSFNFGALQPTFYQASTYGRYINVTIYLSGSSVSKLLVIEGKQCSEVTDNLAFTNFRNESSNKYEFAYIKNDYKLYYENASGTITILATECYPSFPNLSYRNGVLNFYSTDNGSRYFTLTGVEISTQVLTYGSSIGIFNNYIVLDSGSSATSHKTTLLNSDGTYSSQFDGSCAIYNSNYILRLTNNGATKSLDALDKSFNVYKPLKTFQNDMPRYNIMKSYDTETNAGKFSSFSIYFMPESGTSVYETVNLDDKLNIISGQIPYAKLANGTYIYTKGVEGQGYTFVDVNGNQIIINGYTLSTYAPNYTSEISAYHSELCVQHNKEDIFGAKDRQGKFGAINSQGQVVIPFLYSKQCDSGTLASHYALGYRYGKGEFIDYNNPPEPQPIPRPVVTETTTSSISIEWDAIPGAEKYAVATQNPDGSFNTYTTSLTNTEYTISGLSESHTYKILVQAYVDGSGTSYTQDDLLEASTKGGRPIPHIVSTGDGTATIAGDEIEGADDYAVSEKINGSYVTIEKNISNLQYTITDLANNYDHYILVQARFGSTYSSFDDGNLLKVKPEGSTVKPNITSIQASGMQINLQWTTVPGATQYVVNGKTKTSGWYNATVGKSVTDYSITGLKDSTEYTCLVQSVYYGSYSQGTADDCKTATTQILKPVPRKVTTGDGTATIAGDAIDGSDGYIIQKLENGSGKTLELDYQGTQYTVTNLANNYEHKILVQARFGSDYSVYDPDLVLAVTPTGSTIKPTIDIIEAEGMKINLSWNQVPGSQQYAVNGKTKTSGWYCKFVGADTLNTSITGLKDSTEYTCVVQANIYGTWSQFVDSDCKKATTKQLKPVPKEVSTGDGTATIKWDAIDGADGYIIQELENGAGKTFVKDYKSTQYTIDDLANNYGHNIIVQAQFGSSYSAFDWDLVLLVTPTGSTIKPSITATQSGDYSINVTGNKVPGAKQYAVNFKTRTSGWYCKFVDAGTLTTTLTGLQDSVQYTLLVQANIYGSWSSFTDDDLAYENPTKIRPVPEVVQLGDGTAKIKGNAVPNAKGYVIQERENGVGFDFIRDYQDTEYTVTNIANNFGHNIIVQAQYDSGFSPFSEDIILLVKPEGPTVKPAISKLTAGDGSAHVEGGQVPGAQRYAVNYRVTGTSGWSCYFVERDTLEFDIPNLTSGRSYDVLVQSCIYGTWSSFVASDIKTVTPNTQNINVFGNLFDGLVGIVNDLNASLSSIFV